MATQITTISNEQLEKLKKKSMRYMIDSPSSKGYSPQVIREKMTGFVLDDTDSIIALLRSIITEINTNITTDNATITDITSRLVVVEGNDQALRAYVSITDITEPIGSIALGILNTTYNNVMVYNGYVYRLYKIEENAKKYYAKFDKDYGVITLNTSTGALSHTNVNYETLADTLNTNLTSLTSTVNTHIADTVRHVTANERTSWNNRSEASFNSSNLVLSKGETYNPVSSSSVISYVVVNNELRAIVDQGARDLINALPTIRKIRARDAATTPKDVQWVDDGVTIIGTLEITTETQFNEYSNTVILVPSSNYNPDNDVFDEYYLMQENNEYVWEKFGNTNVDYEGINAAETARVNAETLRVAAETARASAESTRVSNETTRVSQENARVTAETARGSAESTRNVSELSRLAQEAERRTAEDAREAAETARAALFTSNESTRQSTFETAEAARQAAFVLAQNSRNTAFETAETSRATAETSRVSAESARVLAEQGRVSAESARVTAETNRASAETLRVSAEEVRVSNETTRQTTFATWENTINAKANKTYVDSKDTNLQYEIADIKSKLFDTIISVKNSNNEYASNVSVPLAITENDTAFPVISNSNFEISTLKGHSLKWNQLVKALNSTNWTATNSSASYSSGVATFTATAQYGNLNHTADVNLVNGHKYLVFVTFKLTTGSTSVRADIYSGSSIQKRLSCAETTNTQVLSNIFTCETSGALKIIVNDARSSDWDAIQVSNIMCIDLTSIGLDSLTTVNEAKAEILKRYNIDLNTYQTYDVGSIKNSNIASLESHKANVWDEVTEGGRLNGTTGANEDSATQIRSKNYIPVIPNTNYYFRIPNASTTAVRICAYDKSQNFVGVYIADSGTWEASNSGGYNLTHPQFTTPSNAWYIRFSLGSAYGTTYNNDISIYKGTTDLGYIAYQVLGSITIPDIDLYGVGNAQDTLEFIEQANGTYNLVHTQNIASVDLGSLDWTSAIYNNVNGFYSTGISTLVKKPSSCLCAIYKNNTNDSDFNNNGVDLEIEINSLGNIKVKNNAYTDATQFKQAMDGVILHYELATPVVTTVATGLLFNQVTLLTNKYGFILVNNKATSNVNADVSFNIAVKEFRNE